MSESMPPPARLARVESQAEPKNEVFSDAVVRPPPKMTRQVSVDLTDKKTEDVLKNGIDDIGANDLMPPPPARLARVESQAEPKNDVFADAVFGSPPKMTRQVSVDLTDKKAIEDIRKNGLYDYLLVNDIEIAVNDRSLIMAQLEYLDSI